MANIKKIKIGSTTYDVRDDSAARKGMYVGTCASDQAALAEKTVTVDTFPVDGNGKPLIGTIIGVKYEASNTYKTDTENNIPEAAHKINVNGTGAIQIYYNNAALKSSTSANTIAAGYKNRYVYYQYDGTYWVWINHSTDSNSTYSAMTQAEINAGTGTTGRTLTPALLRSNFYTETEVNTLLTDYIDGEQYAEDNAYISGQLERLDDFAEKDTDGRLNATQATAIALDGFIGDSNLPPYGYSYNPTTKKIRYSYSQNNQSNFIDFDPDERLIYYNKAQEKFFSFDSTDGMVEIETSVAQVQSDWTESDSADPAYIQNKPTLATVATSGSYNDLSNKPTIPSVGTLNTNNATAQTASSSESFSGNISLHKVSKTGSYNDLLSKPDLLDATYSSGTVYFINSSTPTAAPTNYYTKSEIDTKIGNIETLLASI